MTRLLVGTDEGLYELHGDDVASPPAPNRAPVGFAGREVTAVATDALELWAIVDGTSVHRVAGDGRLTEVAAIRGAQGRCLLPTTSGLLVGTSGAHLLALGDDGFAPVESFERVEGRPDWYTPWGGPPDIRSLSANSSGVVYVNVHVGGIVRSADEGRTWHPTIDIDADVHQVVAHPDLDRVVLAATARGLAVSADGGSSWRFHTAGLHATYSRAVAVSGDTILLSASEGPRGESSAVYRATLDEEITFERCERGLPRWFRRNVDTGCLHSSGNRAAFVTSEGAAYFSADGGEQWSLVAEDLPAAGALLIAESQDRSTIGP